MLHPATRITALITAFLAMISRALDRLLIPQPVWKDTEDTTRADSAPAELLPKSRTGEGLQPWRA